MLQKHVGEAKTNEEKHEKRENAEKHVEKKNISADISAEPIKNNFIYVNFH